jgi:hypothetical protein
VATSDWPLILSRLVARGTATAAAISAGYGACRWVAPANALARLVRHREHLLGGDEAGRMALTVIPCAAFSWRASTTIPKKRRPSGA